MKAWPYIAAFIVELAVITFVPDPLLGGLGSALVFCLLILAFPPK
jgi:hypothetical protein